MCVAIFLVTVTYMLSLMLEAKGNISAGIFRAYAAPLTMDPIQHVVKRYQSLLLVFESKYMLLLRLCFEKALCVAAALL